MPLFINNNFSCVSSTIEADSVEFVGGTCVCTNSNFIVAGQFEASEGVFFANNCWGGSTLEVGEFSFEGNASHQLNLVTLNDWILTIAGSGNASYCNVSNSDASSGSAVIANDGTSSDMGGNHNWDFAAVVITLRKAIYAYLSGLLDCKVYLLNAPQQTAVFPYVVYEKTASNLENGLSGNIYQHPLFTFEIHSRNADDITTIADEIYNAFHAYTGTLAGYPLNGSFVRDMGDTSVDYTTDASDRPVYTSTVEVEFFVGQTLNPMG